MLGKRKATKKIINEEPVKKEPVAKLARKMNKLKLSLPAQLTEAGNVLVCGQGDVGQLGMGPDVPEKSRPALLAELKNVVDVQAGGMHSLCLTEDGEIFSFGCNDEGALGRDTSEEDSESVPGKVELPGKVIKITCGDSHSACLLQDGRVYAWGSFRDSHGNMGLTLEGNKREPIRLLPDAPCVDIASGADHLVILTEVGLVYTVGCAEQGQLGRVSMRSAGGESRRGKNPLLQPEFVRIRSKADKIWATTYCTFIREAGKDSILAFGLNNYNQLGLPKMSGPLFTAKKTNFTDVAELAGGAHHTIIVKADRKVYAIGRKDYGRLGLGSVPEDIEELTIIPTLQDKEITQITCGECTSFALTKNGEVYAWGMGTNSALGTGKDEDSEVPTLLDGVQVKGKEIIRVSGGGQHTLFIVRPNNNAPQTNGGKKKEAKTNGKA